MVFGLAVGGSRHPKPSFRRSLQPHRASSQRQTSTSTSASTRRFNPYRFNYRHKSAINSSTATWAPSCCHTCPRAGTSTRPSSQVCHTRSESFTRALLTGPNQKRLRLDADSAAEEERVVAIRFGRDHDPVSLSPSPNENASHRRTDPSQLPIRTACARMRLSSR